MEVITMKNMQDRMKKASLYRAKAGGGGYSLTDYPVNEALRGGAIHG